MADLGAFGAAVKELDPSARDSFSFFGERYDVVGPIPGILMVQLGAAATGKIPQQELLGTIWEALEVSLDEPDLEGELAEIVAATPGSALQPLKQFERFRAAARRNRAELESLMQLVMALFEATDGRPTEAAPGSGAGPLSTSPSSSTSSSTLQALPGMRPVSEVLAG